MDRESSVPRTRPPPEGATHALWTDFSAEVSASAESRYPQIVSREGRGLTPEFRQSVRRVADAGMQGGTPDEGDRDSAAAGIPR